MDDEDRRQEQGIPVKETTMVGKIAAGVAALGLVGGAGSVAWHDGTATVKVKDANGVTHSTDLEMGGQQYRCPSGEPDKLASIVEEAGRIKITIDAGVSDRARYNALVDAYNAKADQYNARIREDCDPA
jgi:hypothetical protein